jgi:hypothetical protein
VATSSSSAVTLPGQPRPMTSITIDGRRLDSKEAVLDWLAAVDVWANEQLGQNRHYHQSLAC